MNGISRSYRVRVRVLDVAGHHLRADSDTAVEVGHRVVVGREGDVAVGIDPDDPGLSRRALVVTARDDGWDVAAPNRYGAMLQPWGQPATWLDTGPTVFSLPLLGIRLIGSAGELHHWVLLEARHVVPAAVSDSSPDRTVGTVVGDPPPPLTSKQREALNVVFAQHLAWPPVAGPVPLTLQAAARRLGVSDSAVAQRLEAAQRIAYSLGAHRQVSVVEPDFVHVLVRHGYIAAPTA